LLEANATFALCAHVVILYRYIEYDEQWISYFFYCALLW